MSGSSFCDRVREHGHAVSKKGARFYFEKNPPLPPLQEKVKTASSHADLRGLYPRSLKTRDPSMVQEIVGHIIGSMGMEHDGETISLHSHHSVRGFPGPNSVFPDEIETTPWQEKLQESPRIRKESMDNTSPALTSDQKPIRTAEKIRRLRSFEKSQPTLTLLVLSSRQDLCSSEVFDRSPDLSAYPIRGFL